MHRRQFYWNALALVAALSGVAACSRYVPMTTVSPTAFRSIATFEQRAVQIRRAGTGQDWAMEDVRPGVIQATLNDHSDRVVVDITFDTSSFVINYVSSQGLGYTGTTIHQNYNKWVNRLREEIVKAT